MKKKNTFENNDSSEKFFQPLLYNYSWTGSKANKINIEYSFMTDKTSIYNNIEILNKKEQATVKKALELWENVANIKFVESTDQNNHDYNFKIFIRKGDLNITNSNEKPPNIAIAGTTELRNAVNSILIVGADIVIDKNTFKKSEPGQAGFKTILHEVGHALGLKHPGKYADDEVGPFLSKEEDNSVFSLMSYHPKKNMDFSIFPSTPMSYDIAAIQHLYEANKNFNSDDTIYNFKNDSNIFSLTNKTQKLYTIWDGGGNDTIDASKTKTNNIIDLREGPNHISTIGEHIFTIGFNANIENIVSGDGSDIIFGNDLNNNITTGGGKDVIYPGTGRNSIFFGKDPKKIVIKQDEKFARNKIYNFKTNVDKIDISDFKQMIRNPENNIVDLNIKTDPTGLYLSLPNCKIVLNGLTEIPLSDIII